MTRGPRSRVADRSTSARSPATILASSATRSLTCSGVVLPAGKRKRAHTAPSRCGRQTRGGSPVPRVTRTCAGRPQHRSPPPATAQRSPLTATTAVGEPRPATGQRAGVGNRSCARWSSCSTPTSTPRSAGSGGGWPTPGCQAWRTTSTGRTDPTSRSARLSTWTSLRSARPSGGRCPCPSAGAPRGLHQRAAPARRPARRARPDSGAGRAALPRARAAPPGGRGACRSPPTGALVTARHAQPPAAREPARHGRRAARGLARHGRLARRSPHLRLRRARRRGVDRRRRLPSAVTQGARGSGLRSHLST